MIMRMNMKLKRMKLEALQLLVIQVAMVLARCLALPPFIFKIVVTNCDRTGTVTWFVLGSYVIPNTLIVDSVSSWSSYPSFTSDAIASLLVLFAGDVVLIIWGALYPSEAVSIRCVKLISTMLFSCSSSSSTSQGSALLRRDSTRRSFAGSISST